MQTIIPLGANGALRLTTARYYTPSGRSIQAKGIDPDIEVKEDLPADVASQLGDEPKASSASRAISTAKAPATRAPGGCLRSAGREGRQAAALRARSSPRPAVERGFPAGPESRHTELTPRQGGALAAPLSSPALGRRSRATAWRMKVCPPGHQRGRGVNEAVAVASLLLQGLSGNSVAFRDATPSSPGWERAVSLGEERV